MMTGQRAAFVAILIGLGAGWGVTMPLIKITVDAGYRPIGLIFWQLAVAVLLLGPVLALRRRWFRVTPRVLWFAVLIALLGTLLPNAASYRAALYLPAGIMAIVIAAVPLFAFPVALALGNDRFAWRRLLGLGVGLAGVALLVGPEASLPDPAMAVWIPLALIAPALYGVEGNVVARWGTAGLGPIQLLFAASLTGTVLTGPLAVALGQWITPPMPWNWGLPEVAFTLSSVAHALIYVAYIWLVRRAGAVFAAQVAYLVTGFGVLWSMALLGEGYSTWVWAALGAMFAGLFLVQPRPGDAEPAARHEKH